MMQGKLCRIWQAVLWAGIHGQTGSREAPELSIPLETCSHSHPAVHPIIAPCWVRAYLLQLSFSQVARLINLTPLLKQQCSTCILGPSHELLFSCTCRRPEYVMGHSPEGNGQGYTDAHMRAQGHLDSGLPEIAIPNWHLSAVSSHQGIFLQHSRRAEIMLQSMWMQDSSI